MDKPLQNAILAAGLEVAPEVRQGLLTFAAELLKWNQKVNLTAITDPEGVVDKHLVDSLLVLPEVKGAGTLLDLGAGAGLPGIPLALALPELRVTLVESISKKVGFMKHVSAKLGLSGRVTALHLTARGEPEKEGLERAEVVVSRALMDLGPWLKLGRAYLKPGGRLLAMLGQAPSDDAMRAAAKQHGLALTTARRYRLPLSGDPRAVASFTFHVEHRSVF